MVRVAARRRSCRARDDADPVGCGGDGLARYARAHLPRRRLPGPECELLRRSRGSEIVVVRVEVGVALPACRLVERLRRGVVDGGLEHDDLRTGLARMLERSL